MRRDIKVVLAAALVLVAWESLAADVPLRVEVVTSAPRQRNPILVHITNLTMTKLQLVLPMYRSSLASDPLDIERKNGRKWREIAFAFAGPRPKGSPEIQPGEIMEYKFGVLGPGEYRVRVWFVVSPPSMGPPPRPPRYSSVVSAPFRID